MSVFANLHGLDTNYSRDLYYIWGKIKKKKGKRKKKKKKKGKNEVKTRERVKIPGKIEQNLVKLGGMGLNLITLGEI